MILADVVLPLASVDLVNTWILLIAMKVTGWIKQGKRAKVLEAVAECSLPLVLCLLDVPREFHLVYTSRAIGVGS